jgi:hypothetical protein
LPSAEGDEVIKNGRLQCGQYLDLLDQRVRDFNTGIEFYRGQAKDSREQARKFRDHDDDFGIWEKGAKNYDRKASEADDSVEELLTWFRTEQRVSVSVHNFCSVWENLNKKKEE